MIKSGRISNELIAEVKRLEQKRILDILNSELKDANQKLEDNRVPISEIGTVNDKASTSIRIAMAYHISKLEEIIRQIKQP